MKNNKIKINLIFVQYLITFFLCSVFILISPFYDTMLQNQTIETDIVKIEPILSSVPVIEPKIITPTPEQILEIRYKEYCDSLNQLSEEKDLLIKINRFNDLQKEYSDVCNEADSIEDCLSEEEIDLLERTVETEAHEGDFKSKCNIASVVLNRLESDESYIPNTVQEIITQDNQFEYYRTEITEDTKLAIQYVWVFGDTANKCLGFHSNDKTDHFYEWDYVFTDDLGHHFYK